MYVQGDLVSAHCHDLIPESMLEIREGPAAIDSFFLGHISLFDWQAIGPFNGQAGDNLQFKNPNPGNWWTVPHVTTGGQ
jgi:hypothetical protein